ncbi:MAG: response regulator [Anaerolineae bacterium]|nr:response regulator [Anaerolineae bacterium]MDQ7036121.1 response regulator [Anaerolineae bacterium]
MKTYVILCIEDRPHNMRLIRKMLSRGNYTLLEAVSGLSGVEMAETHLPDLIFVDINLPDIDGMEVTKRIKANPDLAHIRIIALTANAMYGDRENYLVNGCDGYLAKPVTRLELENMLYYQLNKSGTY